MWESSLLFTRAPFIPIPMAVLPSIEKALDLKTGDVLFDLGCGDGRVLLACAEKQPAAAFVGLDKASIAIWFAKIRFWRSGSKASIKFMRKNFFKSDISSATHVFTYLFPGLMDSLLPYLQQHLKPGTRLVSCDFKFTDKTPIETIDLNRPERSLGRKLHIYEF